MDRQEALRKVTLLRRMTLENGASASEAAAASRMAEDLMRRYVGQEVVEPKVTPVVTKVQEVSTEPWARLLDEFGYQLKTFNGRCSAGLSRTSRLLIRAEDQRWEVQQSSPAGWKTKTRGFGIHGLRDYLTRNTARRYTFVAA